MDRVAIAREERRRQVTEELEFERDRAGALRDELHRIALELEGAGVDEQVFAQMDSEDVELIRAAIQGDAAVEGDGIEADWSDDSEDAQEDDEVSVEQLAAELREEQEAEITRLQDEIVVSNRRQQALERYLELLAE